MRMATRSNSEFRHDEFLNSIMNRHAINFQSSTSSETIPLGPHFGQNGAFSGLNMINATTPGLVQTRNSSNPSVSGLKPDSSLVSEWSSQEQYRLEDGLEKYMGKASIIKYIKIAATLPDKTVRDVALRCRWMTRKRRKTEEFNCGKRTSCSSKDKQAGLTSKLSISSVLSDKIASYPFLMPFTSSSKHITYEDLLDQNVRAFSQIRANLSSYKVEENIDLFGQTRNNLITILNDMNNMPGLMSRMPLLPVAINDANILSNSTLANVLESHKRCV